MADAMHSRLAGAPMLIKIHRGTPSNDGAYHELLERAWILRPASRQRPAGFVRASDLRDEEVARYLTDPCGRGE